MSKNFTIKPSFSPPIGTDHSNPRFNFHGFYAQAAGSDDEVVSYIQVFRNGVIECVVADLVTECDGRDFVPGTSFERDIFGVLPKYIDGLSAAGVPPPFVITMVITEVAGATYAISRDYGRRPGRPFPDGDLVLPECLLEDYGDVGDRHRAVRPAFDAIWNSIGYPKSEYYDDEDRWVGPR